jgi:hypothetical protein
LVMPVATKPITTRIQATMALRKRYVSIGTEAIMKVRAIAVSFS